MKYVLALGVLLTAASAFSQFGGRLPDNKSFGFKASFNYYATSFVATSDETTISANTSPGYGGGFYYRYDFTERFSFQPEVLISSRSGSATSQSIRQPDPTILITETSISNYSQIYAELPLYFKMRWELIANFRGMMQADKTIGVVFGPRVLFNASSSREAQTSEVTQLFNQQSSIVRDETTMGTGDFFAPVAFGWNIGVDFEFAERVVIHANYFRGLTSMNNKDFGFKSFDNRIEVGLGIRIY